MRWWIGLMAMFMRGLNRAGRKLTISFSFYSCRIHGFSSVGRPWRIDYYLWIGLSSIILVGTNGDESSRDRGVAAGHANCGAARPA